MEMDLTECSRISRLLDSVESEELTVSTDAFVRELFVNRDEEDVGMTDAEELSDAGIDEQIEYQHDEESIPLAENFVISDDDFNGLQTLLVAKHMNYNILPRINGKLSYISKIRDMLWNVELERQVHIPKRNILRIRMVCLSRSAKNIQMPF
ncbi:hypothetical protein J6590_043589 [Homalodisca vitripennis]|nr:hypothetical protein J6590_043589 [Homalodisca vitripennis]